MNLISRLFGKSDASTEMLCPHCERAMDDRHDLEACARKRMSRRFFFGMLGGAAAAVAITPAVLEDAPAVIEAPAPVIVVPRGVQGTSGTYSITLMLPHDVEHNWSLLSPRKMGIHSRGIQ